MSRTPRSSPRPSPCKALIEACLLLEEGIASARDIDVGMMAGAGLDPRRGLFPPFWKADLEGLDTYLEKIENLQLEARRALRAAGDPEAPRRPGPPRPEVGPGLLSLPAGRRRATSPRKVKLETRDDVAIAWLVNPPMNAVSPDVTGDLKTVWEKVKADDDIHAMVICSSIPLVFKRRRRHQGVHARWTRPGERS